MPAAARGGRPADRRRKILGARAIAREEPPADAYLPVVRHEQQPGIGLALRKETLRRRGILASARTRAPGPSLDADDQAELTHLLQRLDRAKRRSAAPIRRRCASPGSDAVRADAPADATRRG